MKSINDIVSEAYKKVTEIGEYDVEEGNKPINLEEKISNIPEKMYEHLISGGKGCCFVFSVALMKLMQEEGIETWMIGTPEGTGTRASVLYKDQEEFFVANPVEDIEYFTEKKLNKEERRKLYNETSAKMKKDDSTQHDDSRIPLQEFADRYGDVCVIGNFSKEKDTTLMKGIKDKDDIVIAKPKDYKISSADLAKLSIKEKMSMEDMRDSSSIIMELLNKCLER